MSFFDRPINNSFDSLFDINRDGILDIVEQGIQMDFHSHSGSDNDSDDSEIDKEDFDETEDMDDYTRREILEDAGYDPDDYEEY